MTNAITEKKTTRTILQIKHYKAPQPGWYLLNFFDADLQIGPFATAELAKKELDYFQATSDAAWKRSITRLKRHSKENRDHDMANLDGKIPHRQRTLAERSYAGCRDCSKQ